MSQIKISELLIEHYPCYLTCSEISEKLNISKQAVYRSLAKLQKRNEIQYKVIISKSEFAEWIKSYRINKEE